jgi:hypothetical protein
MVPKREYSSNIRHDLIRKKLADGAIPLRTRAVTLSPTFFFHRTPFLSPSLTGGGSARARQASGGRAQTIARANRRQEHASMGEGEPVAGERENGRASGRSTRAGVSWRRPRRYPANLHPPSASNVSSTHGLPSPILPESRRQHWMGILFQI